MAAALLRGSDTHTRRSSLAFRMDGVLEQLRRVRKSADVDAVHDLRVAIRRCRAVAAIMEEVDAHPAWRKMRKLPRSLFHALGTLRDLQVLEEWVKRLTQDPLRSELLKALAGRQVPARRLAAEAVRQFDRQRWEHLARALQKRAGLVPSNSPTARALVLERYEAMRRRHTRAMDTKSPKSWHTLRVELKRFRYAVESVLPARLAAWEEGLKEMQNLLGETHDLGVFDAWIARKSNQDEPVRLLRQRIEAERQARMDRYRQRMSSGDDLLQLWKTGLPNATAATDARLRATARAMDTHPRRTAQISRLALQLFGKLASTGVEARFRDSELRTILRTAGQLHAVHVKGRGKSRHKVARDILRARPVPLGWRAAEWRVLTEVVRYQSGAEPQPRHRTFAGLSAKRQDDVRGLAGVLRLARELRRCGVTTARGLGVDAMASCVRIHVAGLGNTGDCAYRLAAGKHLLEIYLRRPLLIVAAGITARGDRTFHRAEKHAA